jgi:3-methyl-2-oxobutanoate hydroxymethyltransferase
MYEDAFALQDAGCFAVVFEAVPAEIATTIAERLDIVTIGIGAGSGTSGQVLVFHDLLGITTGHMAKFVKQYADVHADMVAAVGRYSDEVRGGSFPGPEHVYAIDEVELAEFHRHVDAEALASAKSWEWEPLS